MNNVANKYEMSTQMGLIIVPFSVLQVRCVLLQYIICVYV